MQPCRNLFQMWDMELSKRLNELKDKRGVSERQIARSLKELSPDIRVSPTTVNRWLAGDGIPDLEQAVALAEYFGVPLAYLAYDDAEAVGELPADEAAVLRYYRSKKMKGVLDEDDAITGMASMLRKDPAPVLLTGQAALDALAKSGPFLEPPVARKVEKKSGVTRKKA